MNEWIHFFIKIYLSHFILEWVMFLVWEVSWRRGQTTILTQVLLTIEALLSHPGWAAQPWVTEGPSPLSGSCSHSASILSPTDSSRLCPGYILVWRPPSSAYLHWCISWLTNFCLKIHFYFNSTSLFISLEWEYILLQNPVIIFLFTFLSTMNLKLISQFLLLLLLLISSFDTYINVLALNSFKKSL